MSSYSIHTLYYHTSPIDERRSQRAWIALSATSSNTLSPTQPYNLMVALYTPVVTC